MTIIWWVIAVYVWGVSLTFGLLFWAVHQPSGFVTRWQGLRAALLWFITLPLAALVIVRLREFLPYASVFRAYGTLPINVQVRVVSPPSRIFRTLGALARGA